MLTRMKKCKQVMKVLLGWAVRDKDGHPYIYPVKPVKVISVWSTPEILYFGFMRLPGDSLPEVKWSDEEPTKVKITIERCE